MCILYWKIKIHTDSFDFYYYGNYNVCDLAADLKYYLYTGKFGKWNWIFRDFYFWCNKAFISSLWTASCILSTILANCSRREYAYWWFISSRWTEYFLAQLADPNILHFSVAATRYFSGGFIFMIFGLPDVALAIYQCADSQ